MSEDDDILLPHAGSLHILSQTSSEAASNELSNSNNSSNLDSLQFDQYGSFSASDCSNYDAVCFSGDLVREEDENTRNCSPNLVIVDWTLNVVPTYLPWS